MYDLGFSQQRETGTHLPHLIARQTVKRYEATDENAKLSPEHGPSAS
jgi:hypothetical protein